jgi:flavin-dependent dehydrogenase
MIDVVILGSGAAGCATALATARRGASAVVIHRAPCSQERLGETLAPSIRNILAKLGVWDRFQQDGHAPSCGIYSAWGSDKLYSNDFVFHPYGVGWHIDRTCFDSMLADAAHDAGAVFYRNARLVGHRATEAGWDVEVQDKHQRVRLSAKVLVDATGRAASIARRMGATQVAFDRLIGIARFYNVAPRERAPDSFTLLEAAPQGWWYSAFLPGNRLVVVFFTDPELRHNAEPAPHTQARIARCKPASETIVCAAHSSCLDRAAGGRWLAVGDAASAWDPLSSQGIAKALRSGVAAADTIIEYLSGDPAAMVRYANGAQADFEQYLNTHHHYYRREMRWPEAVFWKRRHALRGLEATPQPKPQAIEEKNGISSATLNVSMTSQGAHHQQQYS